MRDAESSNIYALLIGINCYLPNRLPNGSSYPSLGGCVRDITLVENFLAARLNIPDAHIVKLSSTDDGSGTPSELVDKQPTYENMVAAFKQVTEAASPGDQVYIHYAGHGGRTRSIFPQLKGKDGLDETLVPLDIGRSSARYLRDIELASLLKMMSDKGLIVTLVLDSCHSGGATRGSGGARIRGLRSIDTTQRPPGSLVATDEALASNWRSTTGGNTRDIKLGSGWLPNAQGYVLLAACRAHESAREYPFDGKEYSGALTYWLIDSFRQLGPGVTYKMLLDRIIAKVHSQFPEQTPQLHGDGLRVVFGINKTPPVFAVNVMRVDASNQKILLNTGQAQGIRKGAEFAVYPVTATNFSRLEERVALVEITEIGATDSWAKITSTLSSGQIEQGAQAVLLDPGQVRLRRTVRTAFQDDKILPAKIDQKAALDVIKRAVQEDSGGFVVMAEGNQPADYQVAVNAEGEYEIWDAAGEALPNLRPAIKTGELHAAKHVVQRLVHLTKYQNIQELDNHDSMSPLAGKLLVELIGTQKDYDPVDRPEPVPFDDPGNTPVFAPGTWTFLRVKNISSQVLNVTILDMQPDWGISLLYPSGAEYEPFDPGREQILPLRASLPNGYRTGCDVIKVFATFGATNFRWLELPPLDQPPKPRGPRIRGGFANPLDALLMAVAETKPKTRNLEPGLNPSGEWVTQQVEIQIADTTQ